jgi:hypothetical protein
MLHIFFYWTRKKGEKFDTNSKNSKIGVTSFLACWSKHYEDIGSHNPFIVNYNVSVDFRSPKEREQLRNLFLVE